jgi:positive regulator of sigma E activity
MCRMADLKHSFVAYILHLLTLLLAVLVSQSLGLLVGATVMDLKKVMHTCLPTRGWI